MLLLHIFCVSVYSFTLTHPVSPHELLASMSPSCNEFQQGLDLTLLAAKLVPCSFIWSMLPPVLEEGMKPSFSTHPLQSTHDFLDLDHIHPPNNLYQKWFSWSFPCYNYPCQFSLNILHILVEMELLDRAQRSGSTWKGARKTTGSSPFPHATQGLLKRQEHGRAPDSQSGHWV